MRWTRREEFTWAYFRPAAVIQIEAGLDDKSKLTCWHFININAGGSGIETPYRAGKHQSQSVRSDAPLRQGSYRCLAATANHFARESFMDELAAAAGVDPLEFRLAHLDNPRLRAVLETAAQRFGWQERIRKKNPKVGIGLACGTEKGSYVAACAEVEIDPTAKNIAVRRVCQVFDCGAILNPANLLSQVQGAIIMGLGPALREEINFENGEILNPLSGATRSPASPMCPSWTSTSSTVPTSTQPGPARRPSSPSRRPLATPSSRPPASACVRCPCGWLSQACLSSCSRVQSPRERKRARTPLVP